MEAEESAQENREVIPVIVRQPPHENDSNIVGVPRMNSNLASNHDAAAQHQLPIASATFRHDDRSAVSKQNASAKQNAKGGSGLDLLCDAATIGLNTNNISPASTRQPMGARKTGRRQRSLSNCATFHTNKGIELATAGDLHAALFQHQKALALYHELSPHSLLEADSHAEVGGLFERTGNLNKALLHFKKALGIRRQLTPQSRETAVLTVNVGALVCRQGHLDASFSFYKDALKVMEQLEPGGGPITVDLHRRIAAIQPRLTESPTNESKPEKSSANRSSTRQKWTKEEDAALLEKRRLGPNLTWEQIADSLPGNRSGDSCSGRYRYRSIVQEANDIVAEQSSVTDSVLPGGLSARQNMGAPKTGQSQRSSMYAAPYHTTKGIELAKAGDFQAALFHRQKALALPHELAPYSLLEADSHVRLGGLLETMGNLNGALLHYMYALDIRRQLQPQTREMALLIMNVGALEFRQGQLDASLSLNKEALAIMEQLEPGGGPITVDLHQRIASVLDRVGMNGLPPAQHPMAAAAVSPTRPIPSSAARAQPPSKRCRYIEIQPSLTKSPTYESKPEKSSANHSSTWQKWAKQEDAALLEKRRLSLQR